MTVIHTEIKKLDFPLTLKWMPRFMVHYYFYGNQPTTKQIQTHIKGKIKPLLTSVLLSFCICHCQYSCYFTVVK